MEDPQVNGWGPPPAVGYKQVVQDVPAGVVNLALERSKRRQAAALTAQRQAEAAEAAAFAADLDAQIGDAGGAEYTAAVAALAAAEKELERVAAIWQRTDATLQAKRAVTVADIQAADLGDLEKMATKAAPASAEIELMERVVGELDRRRQAAAAVVDACRRDVAYQATKGLHAVANAGADEALQLLAASLDKAADVHRVELLIAERGGLVLGRFPQERMRLLARMVDVLREAAPSWPGRDA